MLILNLSLVFQEKAQANKINSKPFVCKIRRSQCKEVFHFCLEINFVAFRRKFVYFWALFNFDKYFFIMQNNHFWGFNSRNPFDLSIQNSDFPSHHHFQLHSSPNNLLLPFLYSPIHFQNYAGQTHQSFFVPNSYPSISPRSFQSSPEQNRVKIENNQDCYEQKSVHSASLQKSSVLNQEKKDITHNPNQQSNLKTKIEQIDDLKNSKNNNSHKKQNQFCVVESRKNYHNIVSQSKTLNFPPSNVSTLKQLTKELIIHILGNQKPQNEMLMSLKSQILKQTNQPNRKSKKPADELIDDLIKILSLKFIKFKKTKEQMIKYIFRKIFNLRNKPEQIDENNWRMAQKIHKKNCVGFKSMNMKYVEKQFENPIFTELFSIFLKNFHINLQKENEERIDRLNKIVACGILYEDLSELKSYKKMPWNKNVVQNIEVLFEELKQIQKNSEKVPKVVEEMEHEQKGQHFGLEQNLRQKDCFLSREKTN